MTKSSLYYKALSTVLGAVYMTDDYFKSNQGQQITVEGIFLKKNIVLSYLSL